MNVFTVVCHAYHTEIDAYPTDDVRRDDASERFCMALDDIEGALERGYTARLGVRGMLSSPVVIALGERLRTMAADDPKRQLVINELERAIRNYQ
jgi:hypothetical protein